MPLFLLWEKSGFDTQMGEIKSAQYSKLYKKTTH